MYTQQFPRQRIDAANRICVAHHDRCATGAAMRARVSEEVTLTLKTKTE